MSYQELINKKALPIPWCAGCGLYTSLYTTCEVIEELKLKNSIVVSGIGCTARGAGFFNLDTIHTMHGRAIPIAAGIKAANPALNVIVFSGDGDLLAIGGNHLLHAARRNDNLTVICNNNSIMGMTGGQASPTTPLNAITLTTQEGNNLSPINIQGIISSNKKYFYARTSHVFKEHLKECLIQAMQHKGFAFVEIINPCYTNYGRKNNLDTPKKVTNFIKTNYKINKSTKKLKENELGIIKNE